ncbi:DUF4330 family protein [Halorussus litoreus]|uniref:DUF4330 family protein n=1 Tax=Halorussus litoreus TaxID=1710536 RepID=UPI000E24501C|nr:DUF4330 family protein [Halorussus litoreus]
MNLIDDKGRLFGTVNVIDALVVLLVLAVVAAGTALVLQSGDQTPAEPDANEANATVENATRYATLDLGTQPSYTAERITEGDNATDANVTVTDVYRVPAEGGIHVWTRVELDGQLVERENTSEFTFADSPVNPGRSLAFDTREYPVNGTVHDLATRNSSLPGDTANVVLQTNTNAEEASAIQQGDTYEVANDTVATVESVAVYPTGNANEQRVVLGVTLQTLTTNGHQRFLGTPVQIGKKLPLDTEAYYLTANIVERGTLELPTDTADVVVQTTTSAEKAANIEEGDTFDAGGRSLATIESAEIYPTGDATKKRVVLGLTLETYSRAGNESFLGTPIQIDRTIPFRTDGYQLSGKIVHRGATTLPGEQTTTTVTLKLSNLSPDIADGISTGMTERVGDRVDARITDKRVESATVVLRSQNGTIHEREHPRKQDVTLTVELDTRQTDAGLYFHSRQLQEGNDLVLDLGSITVHGQVTDLQQDDE